MKDIGRVREKLKHASILLEHVEKYKNEPDHFKCFVSAFLMMTRSVPDFLNHEFKKVDGFDEFDEWFQINYYDHQAEENHIFKIGNKRRVITTHNDYHGKASHFVNPLAHESIKLSNTVSIGIPQVTLVSRDKEGNIKEIIQDDPSTESPKLNGRLILNELTEKEEYEISWKFDDVPEKDVIELCKEYIAEIENLVNDFESHFMSTDKK